MSIRDNYLTVMENIEMPMFYLGVPPRERARRAEELARRDLGLENSDPEDATELTNRMDEYMAEFEKNGLNTINIDI